MPQCLLLALRGHEQRRIELLLAMRALEAQEEKAKRVRLRLFIR